MPSLEEKLKDDENNLLNHITNLNNSIKKNGKLEESKDFSNEILDSNLAFYKQNIITYQEIIKLIVIGDEKSGKTTFISFLKNLLENKNIYFNFETAHTSTLR